MIYRYFFTHTLASQKGEAENSTKGVSVTIESLDHHPETEKLAESLASAIENLRRLTGMEGIMLEKLEVLKDQGHRIIK